MYHFFVRVFATGDSPLSAAPLPVTFDDALERLARLPSLFTEPDGSFVWRSTPAESPAWQVDGQLYDQGASLFYVELKGGCPRERFDDLLNCVRNEPTFPLAFEWVERGVLMSEATFRSSAANEQFRTLKPGD